MWTAWLVGAGLVACASAPPAPPAAAPTEEHEEHDAEAAEPSLDASATAVVDSPERSRPPSTATYEEALSTPEALDVHDDRVHLTDAQLTGPMRGVLNGCRVPPNARVTIKTAVQNGRAIGVTVSVRFDRPKSTQKPKSKKPRSKAAMKAEQAALKAEAEAKASAKIAECADRAVRAIVWPPSRRRDSFTTEH